MFLKKYEFGDSAVYYAECPLEGHENKTVFGMAVYPCDRNVPIEQLRLDSLVQAAFTGDESLIDYTRGVTMNNRIGALMRIVRQNADAHGVVTELSDGKGNDYVHTLLYDEKSGVFTTFVRYENRTGGARTLEYLASFSLSGIYASASGGKDTRGLTLHRLTSGWSRECRLQSLPFSQLGMEQSWARYGVKCERWGQIGSMPNRGYYPFAAVEERSSRTVWGVTAQAPYSWQFGLYGEKEGVTLTGGLADYETGHWRKTVPAGGSFQTHRAYFTVKNTLNAVCNAFLHETDSRLRVPPCEEDMPVLFNEYCTTWGDPSAERVEQIVAAIKDLPVSYFVIDAGWYKPLDKGWCNAAGDWNVNQTMFPNGLSALVETIRSAGMKAGIWFEYEVSGRESAVFYDEKMHLHRDGAVITCKNRRFLDLRLKSVREYLREKVLGLLRECGFEYLKIDYNDAYGIGCDGAESLGEGGRQVAEESIAFLDEIKRAVPDIVIENCASGGSRIEPLRMSKVSMCSFSDAHECPEIPLVAANVSRVVPARQMQIWAVLREGEGDGRTVYSLCAAMLGRICLSGDVLSLTETEKTLVKQGLLFYNKIKDIVRYGDIVSIDCDVESYRAPVGRQIYVKEYKGRRLIVVHRLQSAEPVAIGLEGYRLADCYTQSPYSVRGDRLIFEGGAFCAGAFLFERTT